MSVIVPRFDYRVDCAMAEDKGRFRERQEDVALVAPELALFAVADGMGGHPAGEIAAQLGVEEVRVTLAERSSQRVADGYCASPGLNARRTVLARLKQAVECANQRVRQDGEQHPERHGMGTTLDVVWLARDHAFVAHAGDGRVYLARSNTVLQLTQDHAKIESLKASGQVRPERKVAGRNRLLNAVGLKDTIVVDTLFVDLKRGDRLLLCTDGVHGQLDGEAELTHILRMGSADDAATLLVARAADQGRDNATAVVIEIGEPFVRREAQDRGLAASDLERARASALFFDLSLSQVFAALAAAVEVELEPGTRVPRVVASDLVAYIVLDGVVRVEGGDRQLGTGALLFPESLVGVWGEDELPAVESTARLLRVRADDFEEVCRADSALAAELYQRLALELARQKERRSRA